MPTETETKRVNVAILGPLHERFSWAAKTLNLDLQTAAEQAVNLWLTRNSAKIGREASRRVLPQNQKP